MCMVKYKEFEGMKVKTIPVVESIEYNNDPIEAKKNEEILKKSIVNMFVNYYKNNLHKKEGVNGDE
ncbi:hypothetical protein ACQKMI_10770 [Lysinibacillus sp. NPDC097214]|uniref:hypothetical protein n=1 Tax=Lysinibacillus sp. NPDC097214 TaxID=3390584 RepID=UPI003D00704D